MQSTWPRRVIPTNWRVDLSAVTEQRRNQLSLVNFKLSPFSKDRMAVTQEGVQIGLSTIRFEEITSYTTMRHERYNNYMKYITENHLWIAAGDRPVFHTTAVSHSELDRIGADLWVMCGMWALVGLLDWIGDGNSLAVGSASVFNSGARISRKRLFYPPEEVIVPWMGLRFGGGTLWSALHKKVSASVDRRTYLANGGWLTLRGAISAARFLQSDQIADLLASTTASQLASVYPGHDTLVSYE
jgi:hypothetical protein